MKDAAARGSKVHAILTDPPYELKFMGKGWDGSGVAFDVNTWKAAYDLLPPGGYLVAFSSARTYHRMACAIEDSGFEIRDQIMWLYGTGFPKSHDVSKAIDKRRDWSALKTLQQKIRSTRTRLGISQSEAARRCGFIGPDESLGGGGYMWFETGKRVPTAEQYARLKDVLGMDNECDLAFEAAEREVVGQYSKNSSPGGFGEHRFTFNSRDITSAATEEAVQWQGWGTALKPAHEPIVLARKPLEGTVAQNVLEHGTGAINVDACRVGEDGGTKRSGQEAYPKRPDGGEDRSQCWARTGHSIETLDKGRWPANVCHDGSDEVLDRFPDSRGQQAPVTGREPSSKTGEVYGSFAGRAPQEPRGDAGSAARFFYCAKASKTERRGSKHPTVKPVALMRWLVRMVTPPGGVVLDPFAGTGTTGEAAYLEGFDSVMVEMTEEYWSDIVNRMAAVMESDAKEDGEGGET